MPSNKKGFTLVEVIVSLTIVGILAAITLPNFYNYILQGQARTAQSDLLSIYNTEKNYFFNNNSIYCADSKPNPQLACAVNPGAKCAQDVASINCNLSLNITDTNFTYKCNDRGGSSSGFTCTATGVSIPGFSLTLTDNPIILTGGSGCATSAGASCNPKCSPSNSIYCP
jgi:prepilin-type N-terminal cleavage/methylation domain-containing protein